MKKITPSMVVALIALTVALSGTAAAASGLISGTQIKNGTISASKLTPNAVKFLKGQRGLPGANGTDGIGSVGPQGPAGPAGAPGSFDPAKLSVVSGSPVSVGPDLVSSAYAYCPSGDATVAGGSFNSIANLAGSAPTVGGWYIIVNNNSSITVTVNAYAICVAP